MNGSVDADEKPSTEKRQKETGAKANRNPYYNSLSGRANFLVKGISHVRAEKQLEEQKQQELQKQQAKKEAEAKKQAEQKKKEEAILDKNDV